MKKKSKEAETRLHSRWFSRIGRRFGALVCTAALTAGFLLLPSSETLALYNDAVYDTYKNMNSSDNPSGAARYIVPNLYRQDASYINVKSFPLVVSGGVAYVPLDIFALYSYLEVVYGKISYSFYINNTKNGHYIAFDIDNGTTTTDSGATLDIESKLFYRTYYVPAKDVCDVLGLNFEFYDSADDGICAARISDSKAKYTLNELVKMYSPTKKPREEDADADDTPDVPQEPDKKDNTVITDPIIIPDDKTETDEKSETPSDKDEKPAEDPYKSVAARTLYLTFDNVNGNTASLLSSLRAEHRGAVFFATAEQILTYSDEVRRILADGHTLGLLITPTDGQNTLSNEEIGERITQAQEALKLVTKSQTRLIRLSSGRTQALEKNGFYDYAAEHGYRLYTYTLDSADGSGRAANIFTALCEGIVGSNPRSARTLHIRFGSHAATGDVLTRLLEFCEKYPQFTLASFDETTLLP